MRTVKSFMAAFAAVATAVGAYAGSISGAGATFPYPIYAKWAGAYRKATGIGLNYQSIGSGGGIAQIKAKTVTFGATDMPLKPADLGKLGLAQFPTVIGGVVPIVNVPGIAPGKLVLSGPVLADIYMGKIFKWNDPAIRKLNPSLNLPNRMIAVVYRADGSGTTFIFTTYLARVGASWRTSVGVGSAIEWPVDGLGAKGNEGVGATVRQTLGSIGYVEYAYAKQSRMTFARMLNRDGKIVAPTARSFRAAAASADWKAAAKQGFHIVLVDQPGSASWPIAATTYILVRKRPVDPAATGDVLKFFKWAYANGDEAALSLDYVPLPDNAVQAIEASWKEVKVR